MTTDEKPTVIILVGDTTHAHQALVAEVTRLSLELRHDPALNASWTGIGNIRVTGEMTVYFEDPRLGTAYRERQARLQRELKAAYDRVFMTKPQITLAADRTPKALAEARRKAILGPRRGRY